MTFHSVETAGIVVAASTATAELLGPADPWFERLGTVGILVVASYLMLRWLMAQLEKKDQRIEQITSAAALTGKDNQRALIDVLQENFAVQRQVSEALDDLRRALDRTTRS